MIDKKLLLEISYKQDYSDLSDSQKFEILDVLLNNLTDLLSEQRGTNTIEQFKHWLFNQRTLVLYTVIHGKLTNVRSNYQILYYLYKQTTLDGFFRFFKLLPDGYPKFSEADFKELFFYFRDILIEQNMLTKQQISNSEYQKYLLASRDYILYFDKDYVKTMNSQQIEVCSLDERLLTREYMFMIPLDIFKVVKYPQMLDNALYISDIIPDLSISFSIREDYLQKNWNKKEIKELTIIADTLEKLPDSKQQELEYRYGFSGTEISTTAKKYIHRLREIINIEGGLTDDFYER